MRATRHIHRHTHTHITYKNIHFHGNNERKWAESTNQITELILHAHFTFWRDFYHSLIDFEGRLSNHWINSHSTRISAVDHLLFLSIFFPPPLTFELSSSNQSQKNQFFHTQNQYRFYSNCLFAIYRYSMCYLRGCVQPKHITTFLLIGMSLYRMSWLIVV